MIKIAILGFGVVGGGVADVLTANAALIERRVGERVEVARILDLREFPQSPFAHLVTHDFADILADPEIRIVAEAMGGSHPAYDFTKAALQAGKHVVTSNKEVVANFGAELLQVAAANGVQYLFEASVGGGIPVLRPLMRDLAANAFSAVDGILNGTTNYILTQMIDHGAAFPAALAEAQAKGYAEANPAADIEGTDAARKIVILAALAFGKLLSPAAIHCEGITRLSGHDVQMAAALGCSLKLIGHTHLENGRVLAMVSPRLVPQSAPLAGVSGVNNAVSVKGDMVGEVLFYGPGAGKLPTASAVVSDLLDIASGSARAPRFTAAAPEDAANFGAYVCPRVFVFRGTDEAPLRAAFPTARTLRVGETVAAVVDGIAECDVAARAAAVPLPFLSHLRML